MLKRQVQNEAAGFGLRLAFAKRLRDGDVAVETQGDDLNLRGDHDDFSELLDLLVRRFEAAVMKKGDAPGEEWVELEKEGETIEVIWQAPDRLTLSLGPWTPLFLATYGPKEVAD